MQTNLEQPGSFGTSSLQPTLKQQQQQIFPHQGLNGRWQSDKDYEDRQQMITKIIHLLQQRIPNAPEDRLKKLPHIAKRLEEPLYRSAKSFNEYNDANTLKHRLQQLALKIRTKQRQAQHQSLMEQRQAQHEARMQEQRAQLQARMQQLQARQEQRAQHDARMQQLQTRQEQLAQQEAGMQEQRAQHDARMQQLQTRQEQLAELEARMQEQLVQLREGMQQLQTRQEQLAQHEARVQQLITQHEARMQHLLAQQMQGMRAQRANRGFRMILRMIGVHEAIMDGL